VEAALAVDRRGDEIRRAVLDTFVRDFSIRIEPLTVEQAMLARQGFVDRLIDDFVSKTGNEQRSEGRKAVVSRALPLFSNAGREIERLFRADHHISRRTTI
jgi:hypothetical protein